MGKTGIDGGEKYLTESAGSCWKKEKPCCFPPALSGSNEGCAFALPTAVGNQHSASGLLRKEKARRLPSGNLIKIIGFSKDSLKPVISTMRKPSRLLNERAGSKVVSL